MESVRELLIDEMRDLYDAEKQITKALPKMVKAASSEQLVEALREHLEVTKRQVERLEQAFESMGERAKSKPCPGMKGIIEEGRQTLDEKAPEALLDAGIIGAAQKVEHYEISGYGTARALAEQIGENEIAGLLRETLEEEKEADRKLTEVATGVLRQAMESGESEQALAKTTKKPMKTARAGKRTPSGRTPQKSRAR